MRKFCPQCGQYTYDNDGNRDYKKCHNLKCLYIEEKKIIVDDYRTIDDDFNRLLKENAEEVRKWPKWKLNIWGPVKREEE